MERRDLAEGDDPRPRNRYGTFLETVIEVIHETMTKKWKSERKKQRSDPRCVERVRPQAPPPRLHGFELMMAPYSVAHMKLGLKLKETGYEFESDERLQGLPDQHAGGTQDFSGRLYAEFLAHEAEAANRVKRDMPITVVIGNPPYALYTANLTSEARALVRSI